MYSEHAEEIELRKSKIRQRYQGISQDELKVIPAKQVKRPFDGENHQRVAVYARVSTDDPNQTSSYELQKNYYEELVKKHENWELVDIYADEGISGTSLNHREAFVRMIHDCEIGKIDLVITKSVSRFARNVVDCVDYSRKLKALHPPVAILFETEGIYTLDDNSEMQLSFVATLAQEESHAKSQGMNRSIEMRFSRGIFLTPVLLGYDHDEEGNLIINDDEADTVRLIYSMYLSGENCQSIAETLTELNRSTKKENTVWSSASVYRILKNERYCGDVLAHKTFTPNYLNHKSVVNHKDRPQYYQEDHHEPIIDRSDYIAVQHIMDGAKYGYVRSLPELRVLSQGVLKGFVEINPRWRGFTEDDYLSACHSVLTDADYLNPYIKTHHKKGEFDLRDYEVTRSQYFMSSHKIRVSISNRFMKFTSDALEALGHIRYVELFYHPLLELLLVRPSDRNNPHAVHWADVFGDKFRSCQFKGTAFLPVLYQLLQWKEKFRYSVEGFLKEQDGTKVLVFPMGDAVIHFSQDQGKMTAYPKTWKGHFGDLTDAERAKTISVFNPEKDWMLNQSGIVTNPSQFRMQEEEHWKQKEVVSHGE